MPSANSPTVARLSFRLSPDRIAEFARVFEEQAVPILTNHGLTGSPDRVRYEADGTFSRLFDILPPLSMADRQERLDADLSWRELLTQLASTFDFHAPDHPHHPRLQLYSAPMQSSRVEPTSTGRSVAAGSGTGVWRTFDSEDGFVGGQILGIIQDRDGYLWLATYGGGVCRFDGQRFLNLSSRQGLADNRVQACLQDRDGIPLVSDPGWTESFRRRGLPDVHHRQWTAARRGGRLPSGS